jgi:hypothetical protein
MSPVFHIGDQVTDGDMKGTVVAIIDTGEFSDEYDASSWAWLETGVLVVTKEAGLVHYPAADWLEKTSN